MKAPLKASNIYVIEAQSGPVKIGIAIDIPSRLSALQSGCFEVLKVSRVFDVPEGKAFACRVESDALHEMKGSRLVGEWVSLPVGVVIEKVELALSSARGSQSRPIAADLVARLKQHTLCGDLLAEAREAVGWSIREMSSRSGVYVQSLRRYESMGAAELRFKRTATGEGIAKAFEAVGLAVVLPQTIEPVRKGFGSSASEHSMPMSGQAATPPFRRAPPYLRLVA